MQKKEDVILQALTDLHQKIDRHYESTDSRLASIEKTQVKQEANLGEHMRRTELLESGQTGILSYIKTIEKEDIAPIKRHVHIVEGVLKGLGLLVSVASFVAAIIKIVLVFRH